MTERVISAKIPFAIWALTFCAFGIGTTEFVIVGLLPTIANDLSISISSTGLLVTLFALGVAIGGPLFTALTGKIERKKLLLFTVVIFTIGNLIAFFADGVMLLQLSRVITGTTHGVFFANAVIIASNTVADNKKASAISLVFAGLLVSTATGVPLGTYIGVNYGWRMTFLSIAVWGMLSLIILSYLLPGQEKPTESVKLKDLPMVLKNTSVLMVLLSNIFAYTGTFIVFTFLTPLLEKITGFSANTINIILLVYGVGVALGNIAGGWISNHKPSKILVYLFFSHTIVLFILSLVLTIKFAIIITLFLLGFFAFSNVPALQLLVVQLSERKFPGSAGIASSLNVSAFNIGAAAGAYIGGLVVDSTLTITATPWVGGLFVIVALLFGILNWQRNKSLEK